MHRILFGVALFCFWVNCFARPKELDDYYRIWKPLELVRGLRSLSVDPFNVFRCLEAVKDLDSEEALDVMQDLDVRPITIYDALADLGVDPLDAYYALKAWLTDPLLHQPGDHYHRVNVSGDPTHPFLHVAYKKCKKGDQSSSGEYQARYMTSEEIEKELKAIEQEYKACLDTEKLKMKDFINKAKAVHSAFDDPTKVFNDFFGERHFEEWKNMFPQAFEGLKDIYKNPLGFSFRKTKDKFNETGKHDKVYQHLHKGREYVKSTKGTFSKDTSESSSSDLFRKFYDPNRYETLIDETRRDNTGPAGSDSKEGQTTIHHTKVFYDKLRKMYVECKETEEFVEQESGTYRRVKSNVRYFSPKDFEEYLKKKTAENNNIKGSQHPQQHPPPPHSQQHSHQHPPPPHPQQPPPPPHPQQPPPPPHPQQHPPPPHPQQHPPPPHPQQQPPPHPQNPYQQAPPHPHQQQQSPQHAQPPKEEQQPQQHRETQTTQQEPHKQSPPHQTAHDHPQPNLYQQQYQQPQNPQSHPHQQQQPQNQQPYPQQPPYHFYQHQPPHQQFYNYPPNQYYPPQNQPPPQPYEQYPSPQSPYQQQEQRQPQYDPSGTYKDHLKFHNEQPVQDQTQAPIQGQ